MTDSVIPRRGRGRPPGTILSEHVRDRIRVGVLINRLQKCAVGEIEMTANQIRAAEIVLRKKLPDLALVHHTGRVEHRHVRDMSDAELLAIAAGCSTGTALEESGPDEPAGIH